MALSQHCHQSCMHRGFAGNIASQSKELCTHICYARRWWPPTTPTACCCWQRRRPGRAAPACSCSAGAGEKYGIQEPVASVRAGISGSKGRSGVSAQFPHHCRPSLPSRHSPCRDLTIPPVGTATGAHVAVAGLREAVSQLEVPTPGEACAIRCVGGFSCWPARIASDVHTSHITANVMESPTSHHSAPATCRSVPRPAPLLLGGLLETAVRDELTSQNLGVAPRFVMVSRLARLSGPGLVVQWAEVCGMG